MATTNILMMPEYWLAFAVVVGPLLVTLAGLMITDLLSNKYR